MIARRIFIIFISLILIFCSDYAFAAKKKKARSFTAKGAILVDAAKNKILYSKNIHSRFEPASTAKIMTAILVLENLDLEKCVTASKKAANQEPSKMGLVSGRNYKVKDLLAAVLMASSNDASTCLAEAVSGSESAFAKLMNLRAKQLGCRNTKFTNSSGLPTVGILQYSSAYDLSLMIRKLVKFPIALELMRKKTYSFVDTSGQAIQIFNHNKLLWKFPGVAVGKTGYTKRARHCFVGNDTLNKKEVVFVVLKSNALWSDVQYLLRKAGCIR